MTTRAEEGAIELIFEVPRWSERWVLRDDDNMPESREHDDICHELKDVLRCWIARTGRDALAGCNIALRWDREHPQVGVDPDVYLVEPAPPDERLKSLRTWVEGHHPPRVAVEVVSEDTADKDYVDNPQRYAASGTRELWVFDPDLRGGIALQVFRRRGPRSMRRVYAGDGPAYSEELAAWLVLVQDGRRLRVADDRAGRRPWPTAGETQAARADSERTRAEAEMARAEAEKARADAEHARVRELEARLAELEARKG